MEPITRHVTALQIRKAYARASKDKNIQFAEHLVITVSGFTELLHELTLC